MRPPRCLRLFAPALLLLLLAPGAPRAAAPVTEFSGSLERRGTTGDHQVQVWVKGDLWREEATAGKVVYVSIRRPDRGVVWTWPRGDYRYREDSLDKINGPRAEEEAALAASLPQELGSEKVAGIACRKVRWVTAHPLLGTVTRWLAEGYPFPLRETRVDPQGVETFREGFTKIKPGPQASSLFDLPPGAKGMSNTFGRPRPAAPQPPPQEK